MNPPWGRDRSIWDQTAFSKEQLRQVFENAMGLTFFHSHIAFFNRTVIFLIHFILLALCTLNYFTFVLLLPHEKVAEYYLTGCVYVHTMMWHQTSGGIKRLTVPFSNMVRIVFSLCLCFLVLPDSGWILLQNELGQRP